MEIVFYLLGGILPAIIWLWFWLKEDKINPEPKKFIIFAFVAGILTTIVAGFAQEFIISNTTGFQESYGILMLILLASTEEILKYLSAYIMALKRDFMNEPVDAVIYMITVALGFAAMENVLYLDLLLRDGDFSSAIILANMRFIGASVLHTVSSGIIGVAIALSFYKKKVKKIIYLLMGIILAIGLHTGFNFLIINNDGKNVFEVFILVWTIVVFLLFFIEKIKQLKPVKKPINN